MRSIIVLALLLAGCTFANLSYHEIREEKAKVDASDGISRYEATILAQDFIITKGLAERLYTLKPFDVQKKMFALKGEEEIELTSVGKDFLLPVKKTWDVLFRDREGSQFFGHYPVIPFYVTVNRDNGQIEAWGLKRE